MDGKQNEDSVWPFFDEAPDDKLSTMTGQLSRSKPTLSNVPKEGTEKLFVAAADKARDKLIAELDRLSMAAASREMQRAAAAVRVADIQENIKELAKGFEKFHSAVESCSLVNIDYAKLEWMTLAAAAPARNFGFGTIGHQAVRAVLHGKPWVGFNTERNRAKKERRRLKGKK